MNFILLAIGVAVIILGFLLMSGSGTTEETFNPEIFSAMKIKVAPVVTFLGFISIMMIGKTYGGIGAIIYKPKDKDTSIKEND